MYEKEPPSNKMTFYCVYTKNRKKVDKYIKNNRVKNKYIIDIPSIMEEEQLTFEEDAIYLKILIYNLVNTAIEKNKDIYYIPDFNDEFSVTKLLNLKQLLGNNGFNVLVFFNEFKKEPEIIDELMENLSKFSGSQILMDY
jgi:hypothetical protein